MGDESGKVYVIDVSIVNTDSATTQRRRGDFGAVEAALWACEAENGLFRLLGRFKTTVATKFLYLSLCLLLGVLVLTRASS
jgi:hypothetical protein